MQKLPFAILLPNGPSSQQLSSTLQDECPWLDQIGRYSWFVVRDCGVGSRIRRKLWICGEMSQAQRSEGGRENTSRWVVVTIPWHNEMIIYPLLVRAEGKRIDRSSLPDFTCLSESILRLRYLAPLTNPNVRLLLLIWSQHFLCIRGGNISASTQWNRPWNISWLSTLIAQITWMKPKRYSPNPCVIVYVYVISFYLTACFFWVYIHNSHHGIATKL